MVVLLKMFKSFYKVISGLIQELGSDNSRIYVDISRLYKELDYVKALQESTHILLLIIYLHFTEKGKSGPCY